MTSVPATPTTITTVGITHMLDFIQTSDVLCQIPLCSFSLHSVNQFNGRLAFRMEFHAILKIFSPFDALSPALFMAKAHEIGTSSIKKRLLLVISTRFS